MAAIFSRVWRVLIKRVRSFDRLLGAEDLSVVYGVESGVRVHGFLQVRDRTEWPIPTVEFLVDIPGRVRYSDEKKEEESL